MKTRMLWGLGVCALLAVFAAFVSRDRGARAESYRVPVKPAKPINYPLPSPYPSREWSINVGNHTVTTRLLSPLSKRVPRDPILLLTFAGDRDTALTDVIYAETARIFLAHGYRVASFDLPNHGVCANKYGEGIAGMRNAFIAGNDPFDTFVKDGKAVIDSCIKKGFARPGRIVVSGTSRAGYLALRLLAEDKRIAAAAVYSPVTDWRDLSEFTVEKTRADLAAIRLSKFSDKLAGKPVFIMIGNQDDRVSTASCSHFYGDLVAANTRHAFKDSRLCFRLKNAPGHRTFASWHEEGAKFLMQEVRNKH